MKYAGSMFSLLLVSMATLFASEQKPIVRVAAKPASLSRTCKSRCWKCFCCCIRHRALGLGVHCLGSMTLGFLGVLLHADLRAMAEPDFQSLIDIVWPEHPERNERASVPVPTDADLQSARDKDLILTALLMRSLTPAVREQLHIQDGQPVPAEAFSMLKFMLLPPARAGYGIVSCLGRLKKENDALFLDFEARFEH